MGHKGLHPNLPSRGPRRLAGGGSLGNSQLGKSANTGFKAKWGLWLARPARRLALTHGPRDHPFTTLSLHYLRATPPKALRQRCAPKPPRKCPCPPHAQPAEQGRPVPSVPVLAASTARSSLPGAAPDLHTVGACWMCADA